ncbi:helix-turn-helix domain-containing protein [Fredinandcohnia quinoae]|uniref:Helix-turn-helix domain-containing protein n=1 Tax=Fredinandcohnia quinoae TaxID=2918902 RepID=A0AAW5E4A8_9BACI|nr:helix-turn-helix domain-containing protein [Fredinandcohnia sp. SECRCQ15]MCH1626384.1 helix-turn-helix domain-containing protein [Fredinandcohnia sp. SECRCQ15]
MKRRNWTFEEIEFLKENIGHMKISTISRQLNRTETAVDLKIKRLGLSNTKSFTGQLTMHELAMLLKIDPKSVKLWIENHGLKYTKKATRNTRKFYFIKPEDFWEWAKNNKKRIDFSKIERQSIIPEPSWVDSERYTEKKVNYKAWTTIEIHSMIELVSTGQTFSDIGKRLNRSAVSIQRKYQRLNSMKKAIH